MVRTLWTAASGMIGQQINVDTIANNLANVNTTGYKTETNEFKSLLYQNLQTKTTTANGEQKPIGAQVGLGVRNASITSHFTQGAFLASENPTSFAISGDGLFAVQTGPNPNVANGTNVHFTRNGNFLFALGDAGGNILKLTDSDGNPVLSATGQPIQINANQYMADRVTVDADGQLCYPDAANNPQPIPGMKIGLYQFQNPSGLKKEGDSVYSVTAASGMPINEENNNNVEKSQVRQGYLEGSNVQVADEMVNLIIAQRAYEFNSKAIQAADTMMQEANELRR
ncbi:MAG: flagellar hook-basal body protein [Lachnospiraceae bacterium]|nr:flagellar hook-basal body protein [Lachnospiraceae bacterium]